MNWVRGASKRTLTCQHGGRRYQIFENRLTGEAQLTVNGSMIYPASCGVKTHSSEPWFASVGRAKQAAQDIYVEHKKGVEAEPSKGPTKRRRMIEL